MDMSLPNISRAGLVNSHVVPRLLLILRRRPGLSSRGRVIHLPAGVAAGFLQRSTSRTAGPVPPSSISASNHHGIVALDQRVHELHEGDGLFSGETASGNSSRARICATVTCAVNFKTSSNVMPAHHSELKTHFRAPGIENLEYLVL